MGEPTLASISTGTHNGAAFRQDRPIRQFAPRVEGKIKSARLRSREDPQHFEFYAASHAGISFAAVPTLSVESPQGNLKQSLKIMGKKPSITTKGRNGDAARNAIAPTNAENALTIEDAVAKRKRASKPEPSKTPPPKVKETAAKAPAFTQEEIALRAYFIAENRHAHGLPGDAHHDWLEAERQIMAEHRAAAAGEKRRNQKT